MWWFTKHPYHSHNLVWARAIFVDRTQYVLYWQRINQLYNSSVHVRLPSIYACKYTCSEPTEVITYKFIMYWLKSINSDKYEANSTGDAIYKIRLWLYPVLWIATLRNNKHVTIAGYLISLSLDASLYALSKLILQHPSLHSRQYDSTIYRLFDLLSINNFDLSV